MIRRRRLGPTLRLFEDGFEGNIIQVAEAVYGSSSEKAIDDAYNLMIRVRQRFAEKGIQFGNPEGRPGHMGVYRIIQDEDDSAVEMRKGVQAAVNKIGREGRHTIVAVTRFPKNQVIGAQELRRMNLEAQEHWNEVAQLTIGFYESIPSGESNQGEPE